VAKPFANGSAEPHRAAAVLSVWLQRLGGALASVILPAGCRLGEQLLTGASRLPICGGCLASFSVITEPVCDLCGLPLETVECATEAKPNTPVLCISCRAEPLHFDRARSFARYEDALVRAIVLLKFEEMDPLAELVCPTTCGYRRARRTRYRRI
jgi:predicted amidophosphoribosyltransferase